ncbi:MAG: protein adenylyltransferase SelO [Cellvibrionaceae bacterium]
MINIENTFVDALPADQETGNHRRQVNDACYSLVSPTPVRNPSLVSVSSEVAELLNFPHDFLESASFLNLVSGNQLSKGMKPYAMCYGGHQFGNWAGQLGDGRAINLGEVVNVNNERLSLQLKGAGPTPYSRSADGLAVLRSSVREFLCSEAMFHLGVPTTRALSLVSTGEQVMRDMFYDGRAAHEPGAVVCRVSPSFIRFGSFEILSARKNLITLKKLLQYCISTYFPHLIPEATSSRSPSEKLDACSPEQIKRIYIAWFKEVAKTTVDMVIHWMRVGFVHGVMNTDNMSIHGLTIDYGPYGWLEDYDPHWTPNTTDAQNRRYRYENQPGIAQWNLLQLANAIYPLIEDSKELEETIQQFATDYTIGHQQMMMNKLGLHVADKNKGKELKEEDVELIDDLLKILASTETDMTLFYRGLANVPAVRESQSKNETQVNEDELIHLIEDSYYLPKEQRETETAEMLSWLKRYQHRVGEHKATNADRKKQMDGVNPKYVLRNYLAQLAIDKAEQGDNLLVDELLTVLQNPYDEQSSKEEFAQKRPEWARNRPGCSMLSCSS